MEEYIIEIDFTDEELELIQKIAAEKNISVSDFIKKAAFEKMGEDFTDDFFEDGRDSGISG